MLKAFKKRGRQFFLNLINSQKNKFFHFYYSTNLSKNSIISAFNNLMPFFDVLIYFFHEFFSYSSKFSIVCIIYSSKCTCYCSIDRPSFQFHATQERYSLSLSSIIHPNAFYIPIYRLNRYYEFSFLNFF